MSDMSDLLQISGLSKSFGGVRALDKVDFSVRRGEILGLVGQNGSGKSTLIKVLAGYHEPDPGVSASAAGDPLELGKPGAAARAGIRFVHQDLGLVPGLGALDNLALGRGYKRGRFGTISWRQEAAAGAALLKRLGYSFDLRRPVGELKASERTGIAIARALDGWEDDARVLVLDEPTASLPASEADRLFGVVQAVNDGGVSIIYVSHRFREILGLCHRVTVLKDGRNVATREVAGLSEPELVRLTIGRALDAPPQRRTVEPGSTRGAVLRVRGLAGAGITGVDLDVAPGEIVGVAGVTGSGRESFAGLVFGSVERQGTVEVDRAVLRRSSPGDSVAAGVAYVPAERLANAAFPEMSLQENLTIADLASVCGRLGFSRAREQEEALRWLRKLEVKPLDPTAALTTLSGGNQQKVMLGRALRLDPRVLLLDEPTQGVDVGAKRTIHDIVRAAAQQGMAVVVAATESEELVDLCDRIVVLVDGVAIGIFDADSITADDLTELTMGLSPERAATPV